MKIRPTLIIWLLLTFGIAICLIINFSINRPDKEFSELQLANIDALTDTESPCFNCKWNVVNYFNGNYECYAGGQSVCPILWEPPTN